MFKRSGNKSGPTEHKVSDFATSKSTQGQTLTKQAKAPARQDDGTARVRRPRVHRSTRSEVAQRGNQCTEPSPSTATLAFCRAKSLRLKVSAPVRPPNAGNTSACG